MNNALTIYGYEKGCPACTELKSLLDILGIPYEFISISPRGATRELLRKAGYPTVPTAFNASQEHVGGLSEFRKVARLGIQSAGLLR